MKAVGNVYFPLFTCFLLCSCAVQSGALRTGEKKSQEAQDKQDATKAFQEGLKEFQNGHLRAAIDLWNHALFLNSDDALTHQYIGKAMQERDLRVSKSLQEADELSSREQWRGAIDKFDVVLNLVPGHQEAIRRRSVLQNELRVLFGKGLFESQQGHFMEAIRSWEVLLKKDPAYAGVKEELEKARTAAKSKGQKGDLIKQYFVDGVEAHKAGKTDEALMNWRKALELDPQHHEIIRRMKEWVGLKFKEGQSWLDKYQYEKAIVVWKEAMLIDPTDLEISQAIIRSQTTFEEKVQKPFKEGIRQYNRGHYVEAIERWQKALEMDPAHEEMKEYMVKATLGQGINYYREEKLEKAIDMWERTLKLAPEDPKAALYVRRAKAKQAALKKLGG